MLYVGAISRVKSISHATTNTSITCSRCNKRWHQPRVNTYVARTVLLLQPSRWLATPTSIALPPASNEITTIRTPNCADWQFYIQLRPHPQVSNNVDFYTDSTRYSLIDSSAEPQRAPLAAIVSRSGAARHSRCQHLGGHRISKISGLKWPLWSSNVEERSQGHGINTQPWGCICHWFGIDAGVVHWKVNYRGYLFPARIITVIAEVETASKDCSGSWHQWLIARRRNRDERQREKLIGIMLSRSSMDSLGRPPCSPPARPGPSLTPICSCTCWLGSTYTLGSVHVPLFEWLQSWSTTPC